jgi:Photosynthesis system II assembly factor YCF48
LEIAMPRDDRERNFEAALARNLQASAPASQSLQQPASGDICPDAEVLAAYHERLLSPEEMTSRKEHIASCLRCQEILVQLEATDEVPLEAGKNLGHVVRSASPKRDLAALPPGATPYPVLAASSTLPAAKAPLRSANWRWLAPAGLLAAMLLVWVAVHEPKQSQIPPFELAKNQQAPAARSVPSDTAASPGEREGAIPAPTNSQATPSAKNSVPREADELKNGDRARLKQKAGQRFEANGALTDKAMAARDLPATESFAARKRSEVQAGAQPAESARLDRDSRKSDDGQLTPAAPAATQDNHVVLAPVPSQPAQAEKAKGSVAASRELSQTTREMIAKENSAGRIAEVRDLNWLVRITVPDGTVLWRAGEDGMIQRSSDNESTWTIQASGVIADLLAGSATSKDVCWIVGRNGAIVRTTDGGGHWQKVPSPAADDIVSVFAVNANQASITTNVGKSYKTTNAGATWALQPQP